MCTRFLTVLASGTFWKKIRGWPSASIAEASFHRSSGTPLAARNAGQSAKSPGGSGTAYPRSARADAQNSASAPGSAASKTTWMGAVDRSIPAVCRGPPTGGATRTTRSDFRTALPGATIIGSPVCEPTHR